MRKYTLFLFTIFLISCNRNQERHQPIIFQSSYHFKYNFTLIIGSDTQKVDSIYKKYFNIARQEVYIGDSFGAYYYVRKHYTTPEMKKTINGYILAHCLSDWKCNSARTIDYNYKIITYNNHGKLTQSCLDSKNEIDDKVTALNFYKGLKLKIEKTSRVNEQNKLLLRDLKLLMEAKIFPLSPEQKKLFLRQFIQEQLTPEQKKLLKNVIDLDEIEFVDNANHRIT